MNNLEFIDIFNGTLSIIVTIITLILALTMIRKYFKYKVSNLLFIGISVFGLSARNWPRIATFISILITNHPISTELYFILGNGHSIGLITWMIGSVIMLEIKPKSRKIILGAFLLFELVYLIIFYVSIFSNISIVGSYTPVYDDDPGILIVIHTYVMIVLLVITVLKLFLGTQKANKKEIRLKGQFIVIGMLFFLISGLINTYLKLELIYAILLLIGVFCLYIGLTVPNWIKKLLLKDEGE